MLRLGGLTADAPAPALTGCVPCSPQAYGRLGAVVLDSLCASLEEISRTGGGIPPYHNLGLILHWELHTAACTHYFLEYERLHGLADESRLRSERSPAGRRALNRAAVSRAAGRLRYALVSRWSASRRRGWPRVAWAGVTTVPWQDVGLRLGRYGIDAEAARRTGHVILPLRAAQEAMLKRWAHDVHRTMAQAMGVPPEAVQGFGEEGVDAALVRLDATPALAEEPYELLVTGTLGELDTRVAALAAQARGIPVLLVHHGGHHLPLNEPCYPWYEGALPDAKVVYGEIDAQRGIGSSGLHTNVLGRPIRYFTRSDAQVRRIFRPGVIAPCETLRGKRVVYYSMYFEGPRYGPYRDVHPATHARWQLRLLQWLEEHSGIRPLVRPHPKRVSTRYDPEGYRLLEGGTEAALARGDVLALDYPTTALAHVAATNKPVLFFDLGLRRLHPRALSAVRERCHYAQTDLFHPEEGFAAMAGDLIRRCRHSVSPVYSLGPDEDEAESVASAIAAMLDSRKARDARDD